MIYPGYFLDSFKPDSGIDLDSFLDVHIEIVLPFVVESTPLDVVEGTAYLVDGLIHEKNVRLPLNHRDVFLAQHSIQSALQLIPDNFGTHLSLSYITPGTFNVIIKDKELDDDQDQHLVAE